MARVGEEDRAGGGELRCESWYVAEPVVRSTEPYGPQTTRAGAVNRNDQVVVRRTDIRGTDHMQYVYVLRCTKCELEYGANGTDVWQRKCPRCQGGRAGLEYA